MEAGAINSGYAVDSTPKVGSVAWWGTSRGGGLGHVAIVSAVNGDGSANIEQYNAAFDNKYSTQSNVRPDAYLHIADVNTSTGPGSPPSAPGPVTTLTHGSRVNVKWGAVGGASDYVVFRDGRQIAVTSGTSFLDITVSPKQAFTYAVVARNAAGSSSPATRYIQTTTEAADFAHLATKDGPASCGRAGDQSFQSLVCSVLKPSGWVSVYSPKGDWGYPTDRAWLTNTDGSVSYCRRVNYGDQEMCDRFNGTTWTTSTSPRTDLGYPDTFS